MKFEVRLLGLKLFVKTQSRAPSRASKSLPERGLANWIKNTRFELHHQRAQRIRKIESALKGLRSCRGTRRPFPFRKKGRSWQARIKVSQKDWYGPSRPTHAAAVADYKSMKKASCLGFAAFRGKWKQLRGNKSLDSRWK